MLKKLLMAGAAAKFLGGRSRRNTSRGGGVRGGRSHRTTAGGGGLLGRLLGGSGRSGGRRY